jgi:DNA-binding NtrC family response regulator
MSDTTNDLPEIPVEILIVDDDDKIRELLTLWFKAAGYNVHEAPDAMTGLSMLSQLPIAVMTVDKDMPEHDGVWLVEQVQKAHPGVAMLLASGDDQIPMRVAMSRGIQGYLVKPFKRERVLAAVKAANEWHIAAATQAAAGQKAPASPIDEWLSAAAGRKPALIPEPEPEPKTEPEK